MVVDIVKSDNAGDLSIKVKLVELEAAYKILQDRCYKNATNQDKLKILSCFDCCYELVLKILKKELVNYGVYAYSQVEILKEAIANSLIINSGRWFSYMEKRELINSSYDASVVDEIMKVIPMFQYDLSTLIGFLKSR